MSGEEVEGMEQGALAARVRQVGCPGGRQGGDRGSSGSRVH